MGQNFSNELSLKDKIISDLSVEEKSISGLQKSLEEKGTNLHRLVLTGYLKAMVDLGILREKEIKPARIYSLKSQQGRDIYSTVGTISRNFDSENAGDNALLILSSLFNRPIFVREIERCNVEIPRNYRKVSSTRRLEYIKKLEENGIKVPHSNMMMEPEFKESSSLVKSLRDIIYDIFDLKRYIVSDSDFAQKTLDE